MQRIFMTWSLLTLIECNNKPFGTYWRNIPFYFLESWENYLANQFISNLLIPMPNHIMASHIKSHVHSFPYERKSSKDYVRLESFTKWTIPNGPHKALPYLKTTSRSNSSLIFACWTDSYAADTHFCYLQFKKLCALLMDLPSFPFST
jgi:hypothetical protein